MKNALGLKHYKLSRLKIGQSAMIGPYRKANTAASVINRSGASDAFTQRQMVLCDSKAGVCYKMYLITRVK